MARAVFGAGVSPFLLKILGQAILHMMIGHLTTHKSL